MHLPDQKQNLEALVQRIADECTEPTNVFYPTMSSPEDFKVKLNALDVEVISQYFEDALTRNHHLSTVINPDTDRIKYWPFEEEEGSEAEMEAFLESDPDYQKTFKFFNDVIANYLDDLRSVAGKAGMYKITGNIEELQGELEKEEMVSEGLPQIVHEFDDQARASPTPTNFFGGIRKMLQEGRFTNEGNKCPFGMRVCDLFALKPERDAETGAVTINQSENGALPAFIYAEIKNPVRMDAQPEDASASL